ncbi:MlaD family protein [Nocardia sp. alder85J]|uniref:MlaD family protein n=1 Tax=Nocardia sp. alder85J TaxID=2862949 RepID=UPI001CD44265|nr:MCE family protein [Nocardia sp. alder85J]MCX4091764.1 MCE family protein [Nocardia sp. alder85J]
MPIAFESDGRPTSDLRLFWRGIIFLVVAGVVAAAMIARSEGVFQRPVRVTADLVDVGDGLPVKSDVKYRGVLVGLVRSVTASTGGGPNQVRIDLFPQFAAGIPGTVTARVVPSNVFAVPSVQLVDNGPGPALAAGARIPQDHGLETVRLQTSLTALSRIVAAVGRSPADPTLGILATVEQATSGRGADALRAGAQLDRIARGLDAAMAPDGNPSLLVALSDALSGLQSAAPDLLDAVHQAVVPMQTVAADRIQLADLLSGGLTTTTTVAAALQHNTDTLTGITGRMSPVLDVLAQGGRNFTQMAISETRISTTFRTGFWHADTQSATAKVIVELTPHKQYTRADCPRYGNLAGPSCETAPVGGPAIVGPGGNPNDDDSALGGMVGPVGSPAEQQRIAAAFGGPPNAASDLLLGPLVRGNDIRITPAPPDGGSK